MRSRGKLAVVMALFCLALPLTAQGYTTQVLRYIGNQRGARNLMLIVEPVTGGDRASLVVPNENPTGPYNPNKTVVAAIEKAETGALFKIEMETIQGQLFVHSIAAYVMKPGEDAPHCYVFVEAKDETLGGENRVSIVVSKLGQQSVFYVPNKKDKDGKAAPDWDMSHDVRAFKANDVIDVEVKAFSGGMQIVSVEKYVPPQKGEFVATTDVEIDGLKHPAVTVKIGGKTETFLLPGEVVAKKWVPNAKMLGVVKGLKADQSISCRWRKDGDQLVLKDLVVEKVLPTLPPKKP